MTKVENNQPKSDFDHLTEAFEKIGVKFIVHARLRSSGAEYRYVFIKEHAGYRIGGERMESASLDRLLNSGLSFFEFENGKLASY